jgi:hypothetical protein
MLMKATVGPLLDAADALYHVLNDCVRMQSTTKSAGAGIISFSYQSVRVANNFYHVTVFTPVRDSSTSSFKRTAAINFKTSSRSDFILSAELGCLVAD